MFFIIIANAVMKDDSSQSRGAVARADSTPKRPEARMEFGKIYHTVGQAPACLTTDLYEEMWRYYEQKDEGALSELIENGQCILLKPGLAVEVTDKYFKTPHLNEVRVRGSRQRMVLQPSIAIREFAPRK